MKTNLGIVALGVGLMSLVICGGREEQSAKADEVPALVADADADLSQAAPIPLVQPALVEAAEQNAADDKSAATNAAPATADTNPNPGAPDTLKLSPRCRMSSGWPRPESASTCC